MGYCWSDDDRTIGEGFQRIAREQFDKALRDAADAAAPPAQRVHDVRRRAKKLRALLRLVRSGYSGFAEANRTLRDAARRLSSTRDARVLRDTLVALCEWSGVPPPSMDAAPAEDAETAEAGLAAFAAELAALQRRVAASFVADIDRAALLGGLTATYADGRKAARHCAGGAADAEFHEWRKHAKYHWHHLALLRRSAPELIEGAREAAGRLGELLGHHHDLSVLRATLKADPAALGAAIESTTVRAAVRRRQSALAAEARGLGAEIYAESPKAFRQRFEAYLDPARVLEPAG